MARSTRILLLGFVLLASVSFQTQMFLCGYAQEAERDVIEELKIRRSGFRSKDVLIIKYRKRDKIIVEVIDNGKKVPDSEFPRYQSLIQEVFELRQINELLPKIDKTYKKVESARYETSLKLEELKGLLERLKLMNSHIARRYADITRLQMHATVREMVDELAKDKDISNTLKIKTFKEILEIVKEMDEDEATDRRRSELVYFELGRILSDALEDIMRAYPDTVLEDTPEYKELFTQIEKIRSDSIQRILFFKKFEHDIRRELDKHGYLDDKNGQFILTSKACTFKGKRMPQHLHQKFLDLYEKYSGKAYRKSMKIYLSFSK
jgi:hypothetical protein